MISALLLSLVFAATPAGIAAPSGAPAIQVSINNDGRFLPGEAAKVQVLTRDDGYLLVLQADPDGQLRVLFPLDPADDNFVRGGNRYDVKGRGGGEAFRVDRTWGRGMVYAAVSRDRFRFDGYVVGDHWDYRALAPTRLPREPESELTDLVRHMAGGDFDYDVRTYDVVERVVYASDYAAASGSFDVPGLVNPWCSAFSGLGCFGPFSSPGFAVSAQFFFGRPFGLFDSPFGFAFDPFFDPFFFNPFFTRRFFFDPFFDPFFPQRFFFDPFFPRPFFHQPGLAGHFFNRPFFFNPRGFAPFPFRDRRNDFRRAMNAADLARWGTRAAGTVSRGLRVVQLPSGTRVRRAPAEGSPPAVDARRAGWPVDVSPRRREPATFVRRDDWPVDVSPGRREQAMVARRENWPVDVSPRSREPASEARRDTWPVDVSPRRREPEAPIARRAEGDRPGEMRSPMDGSALPETRWAWRTEDRPGLEMAPPQREGGEDSFFPPDWGSDRGSWSRPSDRGGNRGFGGRGSSRRR